MAIPVSLVSGDSWTFPIPVDGVRLSVKLVLVPISGGASRQLVASPVDGGWVVSLASADSAAFEAGEYSWAVLSEIVAGERLTEKTGRLTIQPDPLASTGDRRSKAKRILDAIEASIEGRAVKGVESYTIEGRSLSRTPIPDLLRLRSVYARIVAKEMAQESGTAQGGGRRVRRVGF